MFIRRAAASLAVVIGTAALAMSCTQVSPPRVADCPADPIMDRVAWPFDRLARVTTDYVGDQTGDAIRVAFQFDPDSKGEIKVSLRPTDPPFVEKGIWPAAGAPVIVRGSRYYELLLQGQAQSNGERIQSDRGVVREVIEVEADEAVGPTIRWVVGFVEPSCMSLDADPGVARIELGITHALP